jgi:hypothetical protein
VETGTASEKREEKVAKMPNRLGPPGVPGLKK